MMEQKLNYCDVHVQSLVQVLSFRDRQIEEHTQRAAAMAVRFARFLKLPEEQIIPIRYGALLHDIGKVGIPDAILRKNGPLTDEEQAVIRMHPVYAFNLLRQVSYLRSVLDIPYCHHEKWDGTGYPRGLKGSQIPFAARMFAIVDVWDALYSNRPYRQAWSKQKVITYISGQSGRQFDPEIVKMFREFLGERDDHRAACASLSSEPLFALRHDVA